MAKKKNKKKSVQQRMVSPNNQGGHQRSQSGDAIGRGRIVVDTPSISPEALGEIRKAGKGLADAMTKLITDWKNGGGVDKVGRQIGQSLRAVQGEKAIEGKPIDVEAFDEVSIDGLLLAPKEKQSPDSDSDAFWVWCNEDEDFSVHLKVDALSLEPDIRIFSTVKEYTIAEAEHLAQMLLSACAFRTEDDYKNTIEVMIGAQKQDPAPKGSISEAFNKTQTTGKTMNLDTSKVTEGFVVPEGQATVDVIGYNDDDDDWDINGVQG